jgi:hypothetical protein
MENREIIAYTVGQEPKILPDPATTLTPKRPVLQLLILISKLSAIHYIFQVYSEC